MRVVSKIQLLVNKKIFNLLLFDWIVKKSEIYKIPKCTPFWHEMLKIASVSGVPPIDPAGGAYVAPSDPLVVRSFLPLTIAASSLQRLQFAPPTCSAVLSFYISIFPLQTSLLNSWIRPPICDLCGPNELWIFL